MLRYVVKLYLDSWSPCSFIFDDEASALEFAKAARVYYIPAAKHEDEDFKVNIDIIKEDIKNGN